MKTKQKFSLLASAFLLSLQFSFGQCMQAWYRLNGNGTDFSDNNNTATINGGTQVVGHNGIAGSALYLNGISDQIDLPISFDYPERTISLWFKTDSFTGGERIIYCSDNPNLLSGSTIISIENTTGIYKVRFHSSGYVFSYSVGVQPNIWYHAGFVVSSSDLKSYINGMLVDSAGYNGYSSSVNGVTHALLGVSRLGTLHFAGAIDEVKIYNCALGKTTISSLYTGNSTCLEAWYPLDSNALDSSGNSQHGIAYGTSSTYGHNGNPNSALYFNGVSDKIILPENFDFPERTIDLWFKSEIFPVGEKIIYASDHPDLSYGSTIISIQNDAGTYKIRFHSSGYIYAYSNNVQPSTWYHVTYQVSPNLLKSFVNGLLVDSAVYNGYGSSNIGSLHASIGVSRLNTLFFNGSIDDVKIYDCIENPSVIDITTNNTFFTTGELNIKLSPNPAHDILNINNTSFEKDDVLIIYDIQGKELMYGAITSPSAQFDLRGIYSGIYFAKITSQKQTKIYKLVKE